MKFLSLIAALSVGSIASAGTALDLYLHSEIDLGPTGLDVFGGTSGNDAGFNPSSLATDGTNAWIVGYNATAATARVGMVRLLNAFGGSPTVEFVTNALITDAPTQRGYAGVVFDPVNNNVVASYDRGSAVSNGITAFGAFNGAMDWQVTIRGSSQGAMDPGFASAGYGYADVQFGSGRRQLYNADTGVNIYNGSTGFIFHPGTGSTTNRSCAFAPNGDMFVRASNDMYKAVRSGENATSSRTLFVDLTDATGVNGQNVCVGSFNATTVVFFNDRAVTTSNQSISGVLKAVRADDGTPVPLNLLNSTGSGPANIAVGNGFYDIDQVGNKLYVLDFVNRKVYVFGSEPGITELAPTSYSIVSGTPFGGTLASLLSSDDDHVFVLNDENGPNGIVTIDFAGAPSSPASLSFTNEVSATRTDLSTFIDVKNQVTNAFVLQNLHTSSTSDVIRQFTITTDPGNFVSNTGEIQVRIRWIPNEDLIAEDGWSERIDQSKVTIP